MNTALLLQWLELPPGPWPPDDRVLLGLGVGTVDAAQAETNALARMEQLRPHQLKHPEVVTEGMNRLAQALIALSADLPSPPEIADEPIPLEAEVVEVEAILAPPRPALPLESIEAVPPGLVELPEIPHADDRRKGYRRIAYLRKLNRAWLALQPIAAVPSEPLASAEMVYRTLVGFADLRALLRRGKAKYRALEVAGGSVLALAGQAHAVMILRELLPGQRQQLAMDWATAKTSLEAQMATVRTSLKRPRRHRGFPDLGRAFGTKLQQNPEWILAALTALLILSGLARTLAR